MNNENKIKRYFKDLGLSIVKTKNLFRFAYYNWITPLILLISVSLLMIIPAVQSYNSLSSDDVTTNVMYLDTALAKTLNDDIKCHVSDYKLVCDEGYSYNELHTFENKNKDEIKYKVYINHDVSNVSFSVGKYGEHFDTDNYIIFFESNFVYRYTYHDPKTESVTEYQLFGSYDFLNDLDFSKIYTDSLTQEDSEQYLLDKANFIILEGYKGIAKQLILTTTVSNVSTYLIFLLVVSLLIKGNFMLKKKGFKYSQCLKISIVASLQSTIIALIFMLFGFNFMNVLGLALAIRTVYIYIKYTGSKKNTGWIDEIYNETHDERFNLTVSSNTEKAKVEVVNKPTKLKRCPKCNARLKIYDNISHCPKCNEDFTRNG